MASAQHASTCFLLNVLTVHYMPVPQCNASISVLTRSLFPPSYAPSLYMCSCNAYSSVCVFCVCLFRWSYSPLCMLLCSCLFIHSINGGCSNTVHVPVCVLPEWLFLTGLFDIFKTFVLTLSLFLNLFSTFVFFHRVHAEWQWPFSGVHSIMMVKSAQPGEGGVTTTSPFTLSTIASKVWCRSTPKTVC